MSKHSVCVEVSMEHGPMYYEAPSYYDPQPGHPPAVFLAGGITNCPRWHDTAIEVIENEAGDVVILNPNRADFPIGDPGAGWEQVSWEQHHLHLPRVLTLCWFPACDPRLTTQPIAMFELGQALGEHRPLVVGADPDYPREADVRMLCALNAPQLTVRSTLTDTLRDALGWLALPTTPTRGSITCPQCRYTSYHPEDVRQGYCGHCHAWTSPASA